MTIAVVWLEDGQLWAAADTRISSAANQDSNTPQVLSDNGPKLFKIPIIVKGPGPSGFFDQVVLSTAIGFAYAGSMQTAMATHALVSSVFQSLICPQEEVPSFKELVAFVESMAQKYIREWGRLSPSNCDFSVILFGFCHVNRQLTAYTLVPRSGSTPRILTCRWEDLTETIAIGSGKDKFNDELKYLRLEGDEFSRRGRLPMLAVEKMVSSHARVDVGGGLQLAWATPTAVELVARCSPLIPGEPAAKISFLGIDMNELGTVGPCSIGIAATA